MTDTTVFAEDLVVGTHYDLGSYTVSAPEIIEFATAWDPQTFHTDPVVADAGAFGGLIASGIHSLGILQRLAVEGVLGPWAVVAGRRLNDIELSAPVRPGDTLTGSLELIDVALKGPVALVTYRPELTNQHGVRVISMSVEVYVRTRASDADQS